MSADYFPAVSAPSSCSSSPASSATARRGQAGGDRPRDLRQLLRYPRLRGAEEMNPKSKLDAKKIAKALGAEHRGKVAAKSGYFGAMQLAAEIQSRFQVPESGG